MPTAQGNALEKGTQAAYRADHVGSFLRPPELLEARKAGDAARLREIEDAAILARAGQAEGTRFRYLHRRGIPPKQLHGRFHRRRRRIRFRRRFAAQLEHGERRWLDAGPRKSGGRGGREAARRAAADGARASFPEEAQSRRHQNDFAERHAVSGDLVQGRADRQGLQESFRAAVGYRRDHEGGARRGWRPRA